MIIDKLLLMSNNQALTASAASTDVIDLAVARDLGIGMPDIELLCKVGDSALLSGGSTTLNVALESSTDNSTYTVLATSSAVAKANLTTGATIWRISLPGLNGGQSLGRYIRTYYTVNVSNFTAGTVYSALILNRQENRAYAPGIAISN